MPEGWLSSPNCSRVNRYSQPKWFGTPKTSFLKDSARNPRLNERGDCGRREYNDSEKQLQAELLLPHVGGQRRNVPKTGRSRNKRTVRVAEVRMVQRIESLPAELKLDPFRESEVLKKAPVNVDVTRSAQEIARRVAIGIERRQREGINVDTARQLARAA